MDQLVDVPSLCRDEVIPRSYDDFVCSCLQTSLERIEHEAVDEYEQLTLLARRSQNCLWFGLLAIAFEDRFIREDFITVSATEDVIKTDNLSSLLVEYVTREKLKDTSDEEEEASVYQMFLLEALRLTCQAINTRIIPMIGKVESPLDNSGSRGVCDTRLYKVFLSIEMLVDLIREHLECTIPEATSRLPGRTNLTHQTFGISHILRPGWCPSIPKRLDLTSQDAVRLFSLPSGDESMDHSLCSKVCCINFTVNKTTYQTKHVQSNCSCGEFLGVDRQQLIKMINAGQTPLISSSMNSKGEISITLISGSLRSRYAAISHVWAGGLGNQKANALPRCQLEQLHWAVENHPPSPVERTGYTEFFQEVLLKRVKGLLRSVGRQLFRSRIPKASTKLYWLDTLCIPTKPIETQPSDQVDNGVLPDYIRNAMNSMALIYAGAAEVLVLDPHLQNKKVSDFDSKEIDLIIASSPWMARSWTLHEGALSVNLRIKFEDTILSFAQIARESTLLAASGVQRIWSQELMNPNNPEQPESLISFGINLIPNAISQSPPLLRLTDWSFEEADSIRFSTAWNALASRTTSQPADVAGILASLLHMSAGEVLMLKDKDLRMKALLKSQERLPISLLFAPWSKNNRDWLPEFPEASRSLFKLDMNMGFMSVTPQGLVIDSSLRLILCQEEIPVVESFRIYDTRRDELIMVSFPDGGKAPTVAAGSHVFLLSPQTQPSEGFSNGLLCAFICDDEALHVRPLRVFVWRSEKPNHTVQQTENMPTYFSVANPLDQGYINSEHPLVIDLDIENWPALEWHRSQAFPFVELGLGQQQLIDLIPMLTIIPWFFTLSILTFFALASTSFNWLGFGTLLKLLLITFFITLLRWTLSFIEYDVLRHAENKLIQRSWASSYKCSTEEPHATSTLTATGWCRSTLHQVNSLPLPHFILVALAAYIALLPLLLLGFIKGIQPFLQSSYPFLQYPEWWFDMVSVDKSSPSSLPTFFTCGSLLVEGIFRIVICGLYVVGFLKAHSVRKRKRRDPSRRTLGQTVIAVLIWTVLCMILIALNYWLLQIGLIVLRSNFQAIRDSWLIGFTLVVGILVNLFVIFLLVRPWIANYWSFVSRLCRNIQEPKGEIRLV